MSSINQDHGIGSQNNIIFMAFKKWQAPKPVTTVRNYLMTKIVAKKHQQFCFYKDICTIIKMQSLQGSSVDIFVIDQIKINLFNTFGKVKRWDKDLGICYEAFSWGDLETSTYSLTFYECVKVQKLYKFLLFRVTQFEWLVEQDLANFIPTLSPGDSPLAQQ